MSSVVYYKFLHQKNKSVIHFDGTSISVFDLKKEIITQNQLGSGQDFNLRLYHSEQPDQEYELDQDVIPRSSYVLAKRSPAFVKSGKYNNASRYVTGKPRINRKAITSTISSGQTANSSLSVPIQQLDENATEEDRIKLMFQNQSNAWEQTQEDLAHHKMVFNKPTAASTANKQDDHPPPGYICYRCGKKDHWIKNCPTNNDPNFEGKKIMRTTGIPKSYLKTISREEVESKANTLTTNDNGDVVDSEGNVILITDEGDYAIAMADSKTWQNYQEKLQNAALKSKREYESKLVTEIEKDNKLEFLDPLANTKTVLSPPIVMTPCCTDSTKLQSMKNFNYNQPELERVLIDNDFHCPNCGKADVFLDSVIPNKDLEDKLQEYVSSKEKELNIKDPSKRTAEEMSADDNSGEPDAKKQKIAPATIQPGMFPVGVMPPMPFALPPGVQIPPPPPPGFGMVPPPHFMPPTQVQQFNNNNNNNSGGNPPQ
ncbi:subunit of CPF (cleavage and polyadenylation factor), putative [Candida dubliniensis CD36]|uniref:Subunit of CPF (Cleavage and polyadenylation factor), putative n=1 Tax=Candida dubliniensis (strain CD36 / ATCC MYA-646 / CBS 7987 / NCPF 3949 / NRRL Y-17841) TaxID=573826 RepID=B9WFL7_CANDC|nr:subunit of CPF (cleavage and polyadenylation factor), putative [Candida dubliniensis CD36]CAX42036.1 subunit of CPF (cleavage and polyadenylation factor), putative [Candida dubliniensis CD36]